MSPRSYQQVPVIFPAILHAHTFDIDVAENFLRALVDLEVELLLGSPNGKGASPDKTLDATIFEKAKKILSLLEDELTSVSFLEPLSLDVWISMGHAAIAKPTHGYGNIRMWLENLKMIKNILLVAEDGSSIPLGLKFELNKLHQLKLPPIFDAS